jgi:hypothetical protein
MSKKQINPMKVITGKDTRWSYANVWEARAINGGTPKFSVSLIIPKSDTVTVGKIKAAIEAAYKEGESKLKGNSKSVPPLTAIKTPLRDGDTERPDDPAYKDSYFPECQQLHCPWHRGCGLPADPAALGGLLRCVRQSFHQLLCLQHKWQSWHRSRSQQSTEDPGW